MSSDRLNKLKISLESKDTPGAGIPLIKIVLFLLLLSGLAATGGYLAVDQLAEATKRNSCDQSDRRIPIKGPDDS